MDEAMALTKWCPHVRVALSMNARIDHGPVCTANRGIEDCFCWGSGCMEGCDKDGNWRGYCGLGDKP